MPAITSLSPINSTSYADILGLELGLPRLPREETPAYMERLSKAAVSERDHPYEGVLDEINLQLGLGIRPAIRINTIDTTSVVTASIAGLLLKNQTETVVIPLVTMDNDNVWVWKSLSDLVSRINTSRSFTATLLIKDVPALQVARQSNALYSISEPVNWRISRLAHSGVVISSAVFNLPVPPYTLTADGELALATDIPTGLTITYQYITWPFNLIAGEAALIGLSDPEFIATASLPNGTIAYQVREYLQAIGQIDRSYWAV